MTFVRGCWFREWKTFYNLSFGELFVGNMSFARVGLRHLDNAYALNGYARDPRKLRAALRAAFCFSYVV